MTLPVMIFAAGFGTRMGALTRHRPKPLIPVAGQALLDRTLDLARVTAPARIVVNTHYKAEMIATHLAGQDVEISHETSDILDTGGGLRAAMPLLGEGPVLAANSDTIWHGPNPFSLALDQWKPERMDALMVCVPLVRCIGRTTPGDFTLDGDGRISFGGDHVYGGVHVIKTDRLAGIKDRAFSLKQVWQDMASEGRLYGLRYPGWWCDVGHPDGLALAERLVTHGPE